MFSVGEFPSRERRHCGGEYALTEAVLISTRADQLSMSRRVFHCMYHFPPQVLRWYQTPVSGFCFRSPRPMECGVFSRQDARIEPAIVRIGSVPMAGCPS